MRRFNVVVVQWTSKKCTKKRDARLLIKPQADHPLLVGRPLFCEMKIWPRRLELNQHSRPLAVQNHNPAPDRDVCLVSIRWLVDLNRRAYLKCLWLRFLHRSCWESWSCNFRIAFLEKFWEDRALIGMGHGYISSGSGAGIFEVRN